VGRKSEEANKLLEGSYRADIALEEAIALTVEALKNASEEEMTPKNCKVAIVPTETRVFRRLSEVEVEKYLT